MLKELKGAIRSIIKNQILRGKTENAVMTYEHRFGIIGANLKEQRMSRDFRTLCFMIRNHQFRFRRFKKLRQYQKLWLLLKEESGENLPWVNTSIMGEKTFQKCVWGGHQALLFCRRRHA